MRQELLLSETKRLGSLSQEPTREMDDWIADLRRVCLDNMSKDATQGRRATLMARLFPLSAGDSRRLRDVVYSECLWASGTLVVCFLAYMLVTSNLAGTTAFVLVASLMIAPVLVIWAVLGFYYACRQNRG